MLKWAIFGSTGLLGFSLVSQLIKIEQEVYGVSSKPAENFICQNHVFNAANIADVREFFKKIQPKIVVNCIALTDLSLAEKDKDLAYELNITIAKNLATVCMENNSKFVHISTDSVFDGKKGDYSEEDSTNPLNYYAQTKLESEQEVKKILPNYLILRTNMYGLNYRNKSSLLEWFYENLKKGQSITGFTDVFFNPLSTKNISKAIIELVEKNVEGLYHLSSFEKISKYEFGITTANVFGLNKELIKEGRIDDLNLFPKRPKDTSLNNDKISKILNVPLLNSKESITKIKEDFK